MDFMDFFLNDSHLQMLPLKSIQTYWKDITKGDKAYVTSHAIGANGNTSQNGREVFGQNLPTNFCLCLGLAVQGLITIPNSTYHDTKTLNISQIT